MTLAIENDVEGRPPSPGATSRRRRRPPWRKQDTRAALVLMAPCVIGIGVFSIWPVFQTLYYSFTTWGAFGGHTWSGLDNYRQLFSDSELLDALRNTLVYAAISLAGVPIAVALAALVNRPGLRGVTIYRTLYFLPVITIPAAVGLMWRYIYNGDYGLINQALSLVGIKGAAWTSDPRFALYAIALVAVWSSLGYNMVLLLAGIQGIPRVFYEAASIDGASPLRQFFSITVPLLSPTVFFVTVITVINSLQAFDLIFIMLGSSAQDSPALHNTETIVYLFYEKGFVENNGGYAAAIAFFLLCIILIFTAGQFALQRKWVHYV